MLINAQRPEELRIAIVRDKSLENFQVDVAESGLTRGNIYRGTIANIQPSLNAAFIDYGAERHGFLAIQDVVPDAYYHDPRSGGQPRIEEVLERGKPIVVQISRDAVESKGASLTTSLSLAGRYLVLTPFEDTRGVSRKVEDEDTRRKLKALVASLEVPPGCGVIVRTNALDQTKATISRDLAALLRLWKRVQSAAVTGKGNRLLYSDQDLIVQSLRDHLDSSIEELLVDDDAAFHKAQAYVEAFMPRAKINLVRYQDRLPLFSRFELEPQIDRIFERRVELPSGGSIVIDATEALTAIDVNSGRSTRAATQEETAIHTNLEAAAEVARQLRLRDIGGLVVVDFIDMRASKNQRRVEKALKDAMKADKARFSVGRVSPNGLLEINRQRIQQALQVRTHRPCPTCAGTGRLASPEMVTLNLLRRIEARAASGAIQAVRVALHPELADAMQNSRRQEMADLEREFDIHIEVIAAPGLHRPEEQIEWTKRSRPAAPPRHKAPAVALQPWDLALPAEAPGRGSPSYAGAADSADLADSETESSTPGVAAPAGRKPSPRPAAARRGGRAAEGAGRRGDRTPPGAGRGTPAERHAPAAAAPTLEIGAIGAIGAMGAPAAGSAEEGDLRRGRKRRRGGRKRKRGRGGDEGQESPNGFSQAGTSADPADHEVAAGAAPAAPTFRRHAADGAGDIAPGTAGTAAPLGAGAGGGANELPLGEADEDDEATPGSGSASGDAKRPRRRRGRRGGRGARIAAGGEANQTGEAGVTGAMGDLAAEPRGDGNRHEIQSAGDPLQFGDRPEPRADGDRPEPRGDGDPHEPRGGGDRPEPPAAGPTETHIPRMPPGEEP